MGQRWLGVVVALGVCAVAGNALAEAPRVAEDAPKKTSQENFGFGAQLGFYNPNGVVLRVGAKAISLEVAAGFVPVLLASGDSQRPHLKFLFPFEVTPQFLIHVLTFRDLRGALRLGYRYNVDLGHGATLGAQLSKRVTPKLVLEGMWGLSYYPQATERLSGDQVPENTNFSFPPELGGGLTVALLFYP